MILNMRMRRVIAAFLLLSPLSLLLAANISIHTVDGLNRPLSGVEVEISCDRPNDSVSLRFKSDENGEIHGEYDPELCTPISASLQKLGYESYFSGFRSVYVLHRQFEVTNLSWIVNLAEERKETEFRELVGADFGQNRDKFTESVFYFEAQLRPVLRKLVYEIALTERARQLLALIAASEDLQLLVKLPTPPGTGPFSERWRYHVATALISPDTEDEWAFLKRCVQNEFDDRWVDAGAIQSLKLTASPHSLHILEESLDKNPKRSALITTAIEFIKSNPMKIADPDLEALGRRIADGIKIGKWRGNGKPRFNETEDKALIDFTFQTSEDTYGYTATFHKIAGSWILRGAHETYQAFTPFIH
jgi:hypothetical protein